MSLVVDASALLALLLGEGEASFRKTLQANLQRYGGFAPPLLWYEIGNTLHVGIRKKRLDSEFARFVIEQASRYSIISDKRDPSLTWSRCFELASEQGLTVYDASYLELALARHSVLATLDKALVRAARQTKIEVLHF